MTPSRIRSSLIKPTLLLLVLARMDLCAQSYKVSLEVQSDSWVQGSRFDEEGFKKLCAAAGITIVPPKSDGVDALAFVQYSESQGPAFASGFGLGARVGYGTIVSYKLIVLKPKSAATLIDIAAEGQTPDNVAKGELHSAAVGSFKSTPGYRFSCSLIAAALASHEQAAKILPWAVFAGPKVSDVLKKGGFQPNNASERAFLAISRRDFAAARTEGADAVEPLVLLFRNSDKDKDGLGTFSAWNDDRAKVLVSAANLLADLGDSRAAGPLTDFLKDHDRKSQRWTTTELQKGLASVVLAVIRALGQVGDPFTLPTLEAWSKAEAKGPPATGRTLSQDAAHAAEELRNRLGRATPPTANPGRPYADMPARPSADVKTPPELERKAAHQNQPTPFFADEVEKMLALKLSSSQIVELVRERGVNFTLDDSTERRLRAAGADAELLLAISKAKK